jgi:hypothetical protein
MIKEGNRKFTIAILYFTLTTLMIIANLVPGVNWIEYSSYVALAYFGGNVGEWFAKKEAKSDK